jgi:tetratricopeptide (TPR) repeat protein
LLASDQDNPKLHFLMGVCRQRAGDQAGALASFQKAAQLEEGSLPSRANVVLLLTQLQRTTEAAAQADGLLVRFPGEDQAQRAAGEAYLSAGRYREALVCFDWVLERNPADVLALL